MPETTGTYDGARWALLALGLGALALVVGACRPGAERGETTERGGEGRTVMAHQTMERGDEETAAAYFAGGCFWGVEHYLQQAPGVHSVVSGYMGGHVPEPTYEQVCSGRTGHAEAVKVIYDPRQTDYETLARLFFEIHDPTQVDRQGPDIGSQYRSAVFVTDDEERETVERLIAILRDRGFAVATTIEDAAPFYPAEDYHQDYYEKTRKTPYCHARVKRFPD